MATLPPRTNPAVNDQPKRRGRPPKSIAAAAGLSPATKPAIPAELTHFDELPDSAHVRLPVVRGLYGGCSASAIWRNVKVGAIPAPHKLTTNIAAWNVGELRQALANRQAA